jgi:glycerol dehydrogenase-like iron-containing ADH family enzyme
LKSTHSPASAQRRRSVAGVRQREPRKHVSSLVLAAAKCWTLARAIAADLSLPVVNCPTLASSDAPCSALSVVYTEEGTFLALAELCHKTLLADGVTAIEALHQQEPNESLERLVEANTLLSGLGFESSGLAAAHAIHNGLTTAPGTHGCMHGEKVAFGLISQLMLESQPKSVVDEVIGFSNSVGLPTTFAEIGIGNPSPELLQTAAKRATVPGETIHNEPIMVTPKLVVEAMRAADSAAASFRQSLQRYARR